MRLIVLLTKTYSDGADSKKPERTEHLVVKGKAKSLQVGPFTVMWSDKSHLTVAHTKDRRHSVISIRYEIERAGSLYVGFEGHDLEITFAPEPDDSIAGP